MGHLSLSFLLFIFLSFICFVASDVCDADGNCEVSAKNVKNKKDEKRIAIIGGGIAGRY